jgi:hypothetical protein
VTEHQHSANGSNELAIAEIADIYLQALERGERISPGTLLARYPQLVNLLPDVLATTQQTTGHVDDLYFAIR